MDARSRQRAANRSWPGFALRWGLRATAAGLVALHLALLARRFADATIFEPRVLARWLTATLVFALIGVMQARGVVPWRGRAGFVLTLIVLLLHVGGPAPAAAPTLVLVLPAGIVLAAVAALTALLRHDLRGARAHAGARQSASLRLAPPRPGSAFATRLHFAPRPPPTA